MSESVPSHPFTESLTDLSFDELEERYNKLMYRWQTARRMQMNEAILFQLDMLIIAINEEKSRRNTVDERPDGVIIDTDPIIIDRKKRFK